jgi:hypothetical protein
VVGRARVLVRGQDLDCHPARCVLLLGPEAASRLQELRLVRGELVTQDRQVAGPLRNGAQQRVDLRRGDRRLEVRAVPSCSLDPTHGSEAYVVQLGGCETWDREPAGGGTALRS